MRRAQTNRGGLCAAIRVGLISDTHGLLRPEARAFLVGCDYIVHGGDIGSAQILDTLAALAPLIAVRGNNDEGSWADHLPETELMRVGGVFVYVIHDLARLDIELKTSGVRAIVSGHSHRPGVVERDGILYINPGSCGPRRFKLPISIGELLVEGDHVKGRTVELVTAR
ncbi:MAG TPA: metallophosphoesterase family protein [Steroidobacteraceae bacterium]